MGAQIGLARHERRRRLMAFGERCPLCAATWPNRRVHSSILLPGKWCKIHQYRDPRPEMADADYKIVEV